MRIACLVSEYITEPYFDGGIANLTYRNAKGLLLYGCQPEIFVPAECDETIEHDGIPVHRCDISRKPVEAWQRLFRWKINKTIYRAGQACSMAGRLRSRHAQTPFAVVQVCNYQSTGFGLWLRSPAPVSCLLASHPHLWRIDADTPRSLDQRASDWCELQTARRATRCMALSRYLQNYYAAANRVESEFVTSCSFIEETQRDPSILQQAGAGRFLLYFGAISPVKGVDLLLQAFRLLASEMPDLRLVLVGKDLGFNATCSMRDYADSLLAGERERVLFLPPVRHKQLYTLIEGARAVALPSRHENLSNALLETLGLGQAPICPNGASFNEWIADGVNGFLFTLGDASSLAETIRRVWRMPDARYRLCCEAARTLAERFQPTQAIPQLIRHFEKTIESAGRRRFGFRSTTRQTEGEKGP